MIDKQFVESFLRLNNVAATASTAEIRTVLTEANWPPEQVREALLVYNTDPAISQALAQKPSQTFRPDMDWSSSRLSSLLGVDVVVDPRSFRASITREVLLEDPRKKILIGLCTTVTAVAIAASICAGLMYFFEVGPFYKQGIDII